MTTFALVGTGYRARAYERLAARFDDLTCVGVVTRGPAGPRGPAYPSVTACLADAEPDFLVTAVPRTAHPAILAEAVEHGVPVLAETPPAAELAGLRALWRGVGNLCIGADSDPSYDARRMVALVLKGLRT